MRGAGNNPLESQWGMFSFLLLVWILAFLLSLPIRGEEISREDRVQRNFAEWQTLSPEKQNELGQLFLRFLRLPAEDRNRLIARYQNWKHWPETERARLRERVRAFRALSDEERSRRLRELASHP